MLMDTVNDKDIADSMHAGNVTFVAHVVLKGQTNVLVIKYMVIHVASLVGGDVGT